MKAAALARAPQAPPLRTRAPMVGLHLLAEWYGCPRSDTLRKADRLRSTCTQLAKEAGFEVLSGHFHQFEPHGAMGSVHMQDAHLAIHTWPDTGFVAVDVYACHASPTSRERAETLLARLRDCLRPVWVNHSEVKRGVSDGAAT